MTSSVTDSPVSVVIFELLCGIFPQVCHSEQISGVKPDGSTRILMHLCAHSMFVPGVKVWVMEPR